MADEMRLNDDNTGKMRTRAKDKMGTEEDEAERR
jgi:hypothetical protein